MTVASSSGPSGRADAALDSEEALARAGVVAFRWDPRDDDIRFAGAVERLGLAGLAPGASWRDFLALVAEPDREQLERLAEPRPGARVALARLAGHGGRTRRMRVRAGWTEGEARVLTGVIAPAFGAAGEFSEHEEVGRLGLEIALRHAVERLDFEAWFQPIVALKDERLAGFEALVRWPSEERGLLPPDDFLPLAGELGLLGAIGGWMRGEAARQLGAWRLRDPRGAPGFVAVNATVDDLEQAGFVAEIARLIETNGLPAGALKIEMTEGEVMRDPDRVGAHLDALKAAGASLALDDFGAGFSSLSRLERFPFDVIKIDRYFTRTLAASEGSRKIVGSVVELAHSLGMSVVAEGVETAEDAGLLVELGCDYGQGFRFAPPLPADEAGAYLDAALRAAGET